MMKWFKTLILCLSLILLLLPAVAFAASVTVDSQTYKIAEDNLTAVLTKGNIISDTNKYGQYGQIKVPDTITTPDGKTYPVVEIASGAITSTIDWTEFSIYIGVNVKSIQEGAFSSIKNINKVVFYGDKCQTIHTDAFKDCTPVNWFMMYVLGSPGCMDAAMQGCEFLKNALLNCEYGFSAFYEDATLAADLQRQINEAPINTPTTIVLSSSSDDNTIVYPIRIPAGKDITIQDNGKKTEFSVSNDLFEGQMFIVERGAKLTLDAPNLLLTFYGRGTTADNQGAAVTVFGEFCLKNGTIQGGKLMHNCSASVLVNGGAKFTMTGGSIKQVTAFGSSTLVAPVVVQSNGTFNMSGGRIAENHISIRSDNPNTAVPSAGGVLLYTWDNDDPAAVMNLSGTASISGNTTAHAGGGIYMTGNAQLNMTGGSISNNEAEKPGGGVCVAGANSAAPDKTFFTMDGGIISGNKTERSGGGVYVNSQHVVLQGGRIEANTAHEHGGGVYVSTMPFTAKLYNALITENIASLMGGGLWFCPTGEAEIYVTKGAAIFGNETQTQDNTAGDDFVFLGNKNSKLALSDRMLGGGKTEWYQDGGVDRVSNNSLAAYLETGKVLTDVPRFDAANPGSPIAEFDGAKHHAIKSLPQNEAAELAKAKAKLIIRDNRATRGGGIGANGAIVIGEKDTYSLEIVKEWDKAIPDEQQVSITVQLVIGGYKLDTIELNKENNWTARFTGLPMFDDMTEVTVIENSDSESFIPQISEIKEAGNKLYRIHILNAPIPVDLPKTGDNSHAALWFALMAISAAGIGLGLFSRKHSRA